MKRNNVQTVLHICNYAAPYSGNFIDSLCSISEYQHVNNVFLFPYQAHTSGAKVWIDELNNERICAYIQDKGEWRTFRLLRKIMKLHKVDRVIMHFSDLRMDFIVKFAINGKKVIRFFHNPYRPRRKSVHYLRKFLWRGNLMVGVSDFVANLLANTFPKHQVRAVVNAINFKRLDTIDAFEKRGEIVTTIMGWDQKRKGLDLALKAIDRLQTKYNIVLQIVAAINSDKMKQFIFDTLGKDVDWAVVLPPVNSIGTYYKATDIFLSPSRDEAFGYAVVEAAYCENSIVASRVDGQAELKIDSVYWFENENVDELCKQIENSILELNDPQKINQRAKVKQQVRVTYSLKEWSKRVVDLF